MAGYGLPAEDIAQVLRIDVEELRRDYADGLEDGRIKANSRVAENLCRKATGEGREASPLPSSGSRRAPSGRRRRPMRSSRMSAISSACPSPALRPRNGSSVTVP